LIRFFAYLWAEYAAHTELAYCFAVRSINISPLRGWIRLVEIELFTKKILA